MVTTAEARSQLQAQRQQLQARQQQIRATQLRTLTRAEVGRQTRESIAQRRIQSTRLTEQKRVSISELQKYEKEILTPYEQKIISAETALARARAETTQWEQARRLIIAGKELAARGDPSLRQKIHQLKAMGMIAPVTTNGVVFIGGLGYSVAPQYQESFIKQMQQLQAPIPSIERPEIQQLGGIVLKPSEARDIGITPTSKQIESGFVVVPEAEIKRRTPLIKWARYGVAKYTEEEIRTFEREVPYKELAEKGLYSSILRKAFRDVGKGYLKGIDTALIHTTGKAPASEYQLQRWGELIGETGLFIFFAPAFQTGAYSKQTKTIQKQITKTEFDKLSKELGGLEAKLLKQKTLKGQLQILKALKVKYVKTPEQLKIFEKLLLHLKDKQIFRPLVYKIPLVKEVPIIFMPTPKIPASLIATAKLLEGTTKEVREVEKQHEKLVQLQKQVQKQKQKVAQATTQLQKQKQLQKLTQLQKQVQKQNIKFKQAQLQLQKQVQKQKQKQKVKPKPKVPIPLRIPKPPKFPILLPQILGGLKKEEVKRKGKKQLLFDLLVKRKGKFIKVFDDLPYNKAKKLGAIFTDRNLEVTFKLVPDKMSKKLVRDIPLFKPDPRIFRNYRISKGKRIPLKNMWIEKRGKRLNTRSEVAQLLHAKRITPKKSKSKKNNPIRKNNPRRTKNKNIFNFGGKGKQQFSSWLK